MLECKSLPPEEISHCETAATHLLGMKERPIFLSTASYHLTTIHCNNATKRIREELVESGSKKLKLDAESHSESLSNTNQTAPNTNTNKKKKKVDNGTVPIYPLNTPLPTVLDIIDQETIKNAATMQPITEDEMEVMRVSQAIREKRKWLANY